MCLQCRCARDEHDVRQFYEIDPGQLRIGRLFDSLPNRPFWQPETVTLKHYSPVRFALIFLEKMKWIRKSNKLQSKGGKKPPQVAPRQYRLGPDGQVLPRDGSRPDSGIDGEMNDLALAETYNNNEPRAKGE